MNLKGHYNDHIQQFDKASHSPGSHALCEPSLSASLSSTCHAIITPSVGGFLMSGSEGGPHGPDYPLPPCLCHMSLNTLVPTEICQRAFDEVQNRFKLMFLLPQG